MARGILLLVLFAVALVVAPGAAYGDAATRRAKAHYKKGEAYFAAEKYEQALDEYRKAYELKAAPGLLFNIAQCQRKLGDCAFAITTYEEYLAKDPKADRALVESLIDECRATLPAEPPPAEPPAEPPPAEPPAEPPPAEPPEAEPGAAEPVALPPPVLQRDTGARHPVRKYAFSTGALGVAVLLTGGFFAIQSGDAQESFDDAGCGDPSQPLTRPELDKCVRDRDRGDDKALLANVFLGVGGTILAGSVLLYLLDPGHEPARGHTEARVRFTPTSVVLTVPF